MVRQRTLLTACAVVFLGGLVLLAGCGTKIPTERLAELKARNPDLLALEIPGTKRKVNESTSDEQVISIFNTALLVTLAYRPEPETGTAEDLKVQIVAILEEAGWVFEERNNDDFAAANRDIDRVTVAVVTANSDPRVVINLSPQLRRP